MKKVTLHRRLTKIEANFDQAAKAIERKRALLVEETISVEQAERTYRQLNDACSKQNSSRERSKKSVAQAIADYFRLVREP